GALLHLAVLRRHRGVLDRAADRGVLPRLFRGLRLRPPHPRGLLRRPHAAALAARRRVAVVRGHRQPVRLHRLLRRAPDLRPVPLRGDLARARRAAVVVHGVDAGAVGGAGAAPDRHPAAEADMIGATLIGLFLLALIAGLPLAVALGVASVAVLAMAGFDQLAVPTNIYAGIAKYPLLAIPMFILAGMIFERSGVAVRLVRFVTAIVGEWTGSLAVVAVLVSMLLGGISGSGPADAAAVAAVMLPSMIKRGYPKGFSAGLIAASGSTAIVIPPSVAFIVYSVMVPAAT